ncbi:hypothetical protein [Chroococcidiopsis sp [FACHB-1243]]|uniref:hypothetical protein n=1 Tax=Chroococcidiopsis sp. [FACHB-1243] TaxID=2692781 RepID=UPI0018EF7D1C|nr:hypothetical protein [Chroococcidiopsis sp. [FACHB-1243]]
MLENLALDGTCVSFGTTAGLDITFNALHYLRRAIILGGDKQDNSHCYAQPSQNPLSLGSTHKFKLRHKDSSETVDYYLERGSLSLVLPGCQEDWVHAVPKTARLVDERID